MMEPTIFSCHICGRFKGKLHKKDCPFTTSNRGHYVVPPARTADSPEDIEDSHHTLDLDPEARNSKRGLLYLALWAAALFALTRLWRGWRPGKGLI